MTSSSDISRTDAFTGIRRRRGLSLPRRLAKQQRQTSRKRVN
ncbi:hypothetical protein ACFFGS_00400 [Lactiplantibacillus plajomi]|uniref:Uncharacterized protein n=1 Tax=Lactiplantibacillus plajomi TaxID=1457217 RepID=A0ABV6JZJ1_9LACO